MARKKILQIIPAPENMYAEFNESCGGVESIVRMPVACLALIKDDDKTTYIDAMHCEGDGVFQSVFDDPEFHRMTFFRI
jgi:hypothetical protein